MSSPTAALPQSVESARRLSRYLSRMLDSQPWLGAALTASVGQAIGDSDMQRFIAEREAVNGGGEAALRPALRQLRTWVLCHLIVRDLALEAPLPEVTETMTVLAEVTLRHAHDVLRAALTPGNDGAAVVRTLPLTLMGWLLSARSISASSAARRCWNDSSTSG